jgi:hypothetical protein
VVDADPPVVLVEERRAAERTVRQQVVDALCRSRAIAPVLANEGMDVEVVIEHFDLAPRDRARTVADDRPVPAIEVAGREGCQVGADQAGQAFDAAARELVGPGARLADRVQCVERGAQLTAGQLLHVAPTSLNRRNAAGPYQL